MRATPMTTPNTNPDRVDQESITTRPRHALGYLLGQWIRQGYDELGTALMLGFYLLITSSLAFSPAVMVLAFVPSEQFSLFPVGWVHLLLLVAGGWLSLVAWLALNRHMEEVLTFQYPTWRTFWTSFTRYWLRALWTMLLLGGGFGILAFDVVMFPRMLEGIPYASLAAVSVTLWIALFLGMAQIHLVPFLVHQDRPFLVALKRATLVAVWKPIRTLFILLVEMLIVYTCFRIPPFILILPGLYSILSLLSLLILLDEWQDPYEKTPEAIRAGV